MDKDNSPQNNSSSSNKEEKQDKELLASKSLDFQPSEASQSPATSKKIWERKRGFTWIFKWLGKRRQNKTC